MYKNGYFLNSFVTGGAMTYSIYNQDRLKVEFVYPEPYVEYGKSFYFGIII